MEILKKLFKKYFDKEPSYINPLPQSGSNRKYYRLSDGKNTTIGVVNPDIKENLAFLSFAKHFKNKKLPVPQIFIVAEDNTAYLQQDFGDDTLFDLILKERDKAAGFSDKLIDLYKKVLTELPKFQIQAAADLNYSVCYPHYSFDNRSIMWDLWYFKYYFLKLAGVAFDEKALEYDFEMFTNYLLTTETDFFLYRDLQSRNIMVLNNNVYFIDFQGGRRGALQYDLASLLFDAKADIPDAIREDLLEFYLEKVSQYIQIDKNNFYKYYYPYALIRMLQAMGAFGFRGFFERKTHFLESVPYALKNLEIILERIDMPIQLPELTSALRRMIDSPKLKEFGEKFASLTISISSFAYKNGIPQDNSGNGGGFVFDCRALPNPGRIERYKKLTGLNNDVIEFFEEKPEVQHFINKAADLVFQSIDNYLKRKFTHLSVSFGCTGGQHRSVYCASQLADMIKKHYKTVTVRVKHRELNNL